jgi:hypothetical protein
MGIQWIDFKGKRILFGDFQGMTNEAESLKLLQQEMTMIAQAKEPVLLLVNLQDARMSLETSQYTKEHLARLNKHLKKIALVGVTGVKTIIVQGIGRETGEAPQGMFTTLDEAKEWLIS